MKKWEFVETKLNEKIEQGLDGLKNITVQATPTNIKEKIKQTGQAIESNKAQTKKVLKEKAVNLKTQIIETKEKASTLSQESQKKLNEKIEIARKTDWKKVQYAKQVSLIIAAVLLPFYKKISSIFGSLQPSTLASYIVVATVSSITFIGVYQNSKKIAEESTAAARDPAAEVKNATEASRRPAYFKLNEKELRVRNVVLPVYIQSTNSYRKLQMDLTIVSSNRYIREYFFENTYHLQDVLNSKVEPIIPEFPLEEKAGKDILKKKIKDELNLRVKNLNIKGEISNIYIHSILGG